MRCGYGSFVHCINSRPKNEARPMQLHNDLISPVEKGGFAGARPSTPSDEEEAAGAPSADDEEGTVGGSDGAPEEGEPDYSENYQPVPMREIQSEHFGL